MFAARPQAAATMLFRVALAPYAPPRRFTWIRTLQNNEKTVLSMMGFTALQHNTGDLRYFELGYVEILRNLA